MGCGKDLVRRPDERTGKFNKRRTCNYVCAGIAGNMGRPRDPVCRYCKKNRRAISPGGKMYATCGAPRCINAARLGHEDDAGTQIHWPDITGEIDYGAGFGAHNLKLKSYGKIGSAPLTHSATGCSAAWLITDSAA
jgi:hypothetical protein